MLHGSSRATFDLDVCFATDRANLDALGEVLVGLDARLKGVKEAVPRVAGGSTHNRSVSRTAWYSRSTSSALSFWVSVTGRSSRR